MYLLKTYVLCTKKEEHKENPDSNKKYDCTYYKTLEEANKVATTKKEKDHHIFEIYGPKSFHNDQVNYYLNFYNK
jgi:hypothetical protein